MVPYVKWERYVDKSFFFSMKIYFQKNIEAEICEILRIGWENFVRWKSVNKVQFKIVRNYPFN